MRLQGRTLKIKEVTSADQGVYLCSAVNGFGKETFAITLAVIGESLSLSLIRGTEGRVCVCGGGRGRWS